jgi:hypothetical protein
MSETYTTEDFLRALDGVRLTACSTGTRSYASVKPESSYEAQHTLGNVLATKDNKTDSS